MTTTARTPRPAAGRLGIAAILATLVAGAFVLGSGRAEATSARAANPSAVAVVDLGELLDGLEERVFLEGELNKEIDARQRELNEIVEQIKTMNSNIETLPDGDPRTIQQIRDLRLKEVEARAMQQFVSEQLSLEKGKMLAVLYTKIQRAVCDVLASDGWDIVLIDDSGLELPQMAQEQQMLQLILSRRVLCASDRVDITNDVKTRMNNNFNAARP